MLMLHITYSLANAVSVYSKNIFIDLVKQSNLGHQPSPPNNTFKQFEISVSKVALDAIIKTTFVHTLCTLKTL